MPERIQCVSNIDEGCLQHRYSAMDIEKVDVDTHTIWQLSWPYLFGID